MAHQCQAMTHFELVVSKVILSDLKSLRTFLKPGQNLKLLLAKTPYLLLPNRFKSHIWDQRVM
jgi:hypothetical protein